jgi:hypothetical protein
MLEKASLLDAKKLDAKKELSSRRVPVHVLSVAWGVQVVDLGRWSG